METTTVATLAKQISDLTENLKPVISFSKDVETWRNDLVDLKARVTELTSKGLDPTKDENLKRYLDSIISRKDDDDRRNRLLSPAQLQDINLPDCWAKGYDSLLGIDFTDHRDLVRKGHEGLEVMLQMPPINDRHKALCHLAVDVKLADSLMRAKAVLSGRIYEGFDKACPKLNKVWQSYLQGYIKAIAPMDTADTATWIPTGWSSELRELITLQLKVAALFTRIPMPNSPFILPVNMTDTVGDYVVESTTTTSPYADTDGQTLVDAKVTFTARKGRGRLLTSGELTEDAMIAMLPLMRMQLVKILAESQEKAIIDGQASSTIDTGAPAPTGTDIRLWFNGLRWHAIAKSATLSLATFSATTAIQSMRVKLDAAFSMDTSNLVYLASMDDYLTMLPWSEVLTMEKYGSNAIIVTGELAKLGGIPIVVTRYMRDDLNASGIYDAITTTKTGLLLVHRSSFLIGDQRAITVEAERWVNSDQYNLVAFQRMDFQNLYTTSQKDVAYGYNITGL